MKDSGSLLSFLYPSFSSAQSQALLQTSVPAPHTPIVFTLPSGSDSLVYFQEQTEKRTRKKFVFYQCVCVCACACPSVSSTSGIPRPGPLLRVWNEKSTLTLQKWIRKHRGHNYQAPWCWNWRRWSANRSVSNHPPHCLPSVIQWVYSSLFCASSGPSHLPTDWQAGWLAGRVGCWRMQGKFDS